MGSYADSLLTDGEVVLRREHQHWLSLFLESRLSLLLWGLGILALLAIQWYATWRAVAGRPVGWKGRGHPSATAATGSG